MSDQPQVTNYHRPDAVEVRVTLPVTVTAKLPRYLAEIMDRGDLRRAVRDALTIYGLHLAVDKHGERVEAESACCAPSIHDLMELVGEPGLFPREARP